MHHRPGDHQVLYPQEITPHISDRAIVLPAVAHYGMTLLPVTTSVVIVRQLEMIPHLAILANTLLVLHGGDILLPVADEVRPCRQDVMLCLFANNESTLILRMAEAGVAVRTGRIGGLVVRVFVYR